MWYLYYGWVILLDKVREQLNFFSDAYLPKIVFALLVLAAGTIIIRFVLKLIKNILGKSKIEHTINTFVFSALKILLYLILVITALATIGVDVSSILATFAAAALTAGLALQESLGNIASGVVILISKPFVAGDILEFEGVKGKVENIRLFSSQLHTFDNKIVTIPNSRLTSNNVTNCTMVDKRRVDLSYTVGYNDDIAKVKKVIYELISENNKVLNVPPPQVCVGKHLESGVGIIVWIWVEPDDYYDVYYFMQENVLLRFKENDITIPYPHIQIIK